MDDLISRQAALNEIAEWMLEYGALNEKRERDALQHVARGIKKLPSVQPEPQWIPCSERLPEKSKDVLLQFQGCMGVGFYENGWAVNTGDGIFSEVGEREEKPIAWMPLPEPYKGGE